MQTFLPYPDFAKSAQCLDYRRLGKQRIEAKQIIDILEGNAKSNAWENHPAVKMWKGNIDSLKLYYNVMLREWINRGYKNNMTFYYDVPCIVYPPAWLTDEFCSRHRAALLAKDPKHYSQFGWSEEPKIDYLWGAE